MADTKGCFPLHLAAWRGDVDIVRILIHHGPSHCRVNEQNHEKETALHCAARYGHSDVVGVLLQELSDAGMRNRRGETPLDLAALYGRLQVVRMLLSARPGSTGTGAQPHTPLHLAARNGHHATVQTLLDAGMDVNSRTEKGSALHEASLYGKMDVVRLLLNSGIDVNIKDCQGKTALEILKEHPAQKSQQITALIQEFMMAESERSRVTEEPARQCPVPAPRDSVSSPAGSPSTRHKNDTVTGELSKLLSEIKMCRDRDYSFEELCQTISSHSHSVESFSSGRLSDEERCGTLARTAKRPSPPLPIAMEEEKVCGPSGLWEALTPCNGCRNLGFTQDSRHCGGNAQSPSLDVFSPQDEDNPYELVATAVTRKPCSLDIHLLNACQRNGHSPNVPVSDAEQRNHGDDYTGLTPDCSPPSPDTALKNIERVIRPQPKQRTSLSSSQEAQRTAPNHSGEPSEVSSSLGYASFSTSPPASPPASPPVSPADCSTGSAEDYTLNRRAKTRACHRIYQRLLSCSLRTLSIQVRAERRVLKRQTTVCLRGHVKGHDPQPRDEASGACMVHSDGGENREVGATAGSSPAPTEQRPAWVFMCRSLCVKGRSPLKWKGPLMAPPSRSPPTAWVTTGVSG
ncbi:hypothetical protein P4O66_002592 [Electrophorus voltai]|uniref:Ankyrin repeat and sterile alpha motif domain containing 1B n=1 Tax=Electrophorus voltai TaxID=2609070 RepID=A0AAD8YZJ5_9TELE|nr:hypothetical protein P4O66_002592 [Electrophorus voltai]